jgi:hypothetical protein
MTFSFPDSVFMGFLVNGMRMLHAMAHVTGLFMDPNSDHGVTTREALVILLGNYKWSRSLQIESVLLSI